MLLIVNVLKSVSRYCSYTWQGIKQGWQSRNNLGLFKLIMGCFESFVESLFMVKMDIRDGYL